LKNIWQPNPGAALSVHIEIQKVPRMSDKKIFSILATEWAKGSVVFIMTSFQNSDYKCPISFAVLLILLVVISA